MRKFPVKALIATLAILFGLIGGLICVSASLPAEAKIVNKYVSAINKENEKKIEKCTITTSDLANSLNEEYAELLGIAEDLVSGEESEKLSGKKAFLQNSAISVDFPEGYDGVKEIKKVKMIGCTAKETKSELGMNATLVEVLVEIQYVTDEKKPETKTIYVSDELALVKTKSGYRIADF